MLGGMAGRWSWHQDKKLCTYCIVIIDIDSWLHIGVRSNEEIARCHLIRLVNALQGREYWCKQIWPLITKQCQLNTKAM